MRLLLRLATLTVALGIAMPASADRYVLSPGAATITLPACSPGGGTAVEVPGPGQYILAVTTADATVCYGASCATGGANLVTGTQIPIFLSAATQASCRSAGGGVVQFIRAERG